MVSLPSYVDSLSLHDALPIFKSRGIRVNVLSPGPTNTEILAKLGIPPEGRDAFEESIAAAIPLGRMGRPDELANAALFLGSEDRKSTRLNSSHVRISYAVFCL